MSPAPEPRPGLRDVTPYLSPQTDVAVRLNTNECPVPLPETFTRELADAVAALPLNRYPDGLAIELRRALAAHTGHPLDGIWVANGSNEILTQLLLAYGGPGRRAVTFEPTYLLHSRLCWLTQTEVVQLRMQPPYEIDTPTLDAAVATRPNVVFVCSPNNPTGNPQPLTAVEELANKTEAAVIIDEAYIEFGGRSAQPLLAHRPNVVVVRTLSKAFALAGARIGYCLASPEVVEDLQRVRLPYHLSALAQTTGIVALRHAAEAESVLGSIRDQRERIATALRAIPGVTVFPSQANFVLFTPPPDAKPAAEVWQELLDRGVLIRDLSAVVPEALRVTAGTEDEVDLFLSALKEVLS
jgi:histidinol-phosphate aminotransferase